MSARADRQRRFLCPCNRCNNNPASKQRKETIKDHLARSARERLIRATVQVRTRDRRDGDGSAIGDNGGHISSEARTVASPKVRIYSLSPAPSLSARDDLSDDMPELMDDSFLNNASNSDSDAACGAADDSLDDDEGFATGDHYLELHGNMNSPLHSSVSSGTLDNWDDAEPHADKDEDEDEDANADAAQDNIEDADADEDEDADRDERWYTGCDGWDWHQPDEDWIWDEGEGEGEDQDQDQDRDEDEDEEDADAGGGSPDEEADDDQEEVAHLIDIDVDDPLCVRLENLFAAPAHEETRFQPGRRPRAFDEHPLVRRAYVQAFVASTLHGATLDGVQHILKSAQAQLLACSRYTGGDTIPGLDDMALTLRTLERRLGLDPDQLITYFFVCNVCWYIHTPSELDDLEDPFCTCEDCDGRLYNVKTYADGSRRRIPVKVVPGTSAQDWLRRLVRRPGKLAELNQWRQGEEDEPGESPPMSFEEWAGSLDDKFRMYDITDAWGWRAVMAGLKRRRGGRYEVEDVDVNERDQRFVSLPNGLLLQINLDWHVTIAR